MQKTALISIEDPQSRTLSDMFETFYRRHKLRQASENTLRLHRICIGKFDKFLGRQAIISDLNDATVSDYLDWVLRVQERSPRTANRCRDNILAQWRFYARKGVSPIWPDVEAAREPERVPVAWTKEELQRLFAAIDTLQGRENGLPRSLWWHSIHSVLWDTGERIGAMLKLDWKWVDLKGGFVTFKAETRKGKRRDRVHKIHGTTVSVLRLMHEASGTPSAGTVWPWKSNTATLYDRYGKILKLAGLPGGRMRKFHCMRRSAASYLEAAGGDATRFLDHRDRSTTQQNYLDPRIVETTTPSSLLFRPDGTIDAPPIDPKSLENCRDVDVKPKWTGGTIEQRINGTLLKVGPLQMKLLELLRKHRTGIETREAMRILRETGYVVTRFADVAERLRMLLRKAYSLSDECDPVPITPTGNKVKHGPFMKDEFTVRLFIPGVTEGAAP